MTPPQEQPRPVEWVEHTPAFDGDAPEGVRAETHEIMRRMGDQWLYLTGDPVWLEYHQYRYRAKNARPDYRAKWEEAERLLREVRDCRVPAKRMATMDGEFDRPEAWALNKLTALLPNIDAFLGDKSHD